MKTYIGIFAGAVGVVLILAGANGSIEKLFGTVFGKGFTPKGATAPSSTGQIGTITPQGGNTANPNYHQGDPSSTPTGPANPQAIPGGGDIGLPVNFAQSFNSLTGVGF